MCANQLHVCVNVCVGGGVKVLQQDRKGVMENRKAAADKSPEGDVWF